MSERWRLLEDHPAGGAWNMAVDVALLESAEAKRTEPVLRIYGWDRPTLSIGYRQKTGGMIDIDYLQANGIPMVRRPTGGRALLHHDELTYSVTLPSSSGLYGSLSETYEVVARALIEALNKCGVDVDTGVSDMRAHSEACCHATRTRFEISCGGRKIAGAAQRRLKSSAMQHGFISLSTNVERYLSCFIWQSDAAREKASQSMGGLNDARISQIKTRELKGKIIEAFENIYGIVFARGELTYQERERAELTENSHSARSRALQSADE